MLIQNAKANEMKRGEKKYNYFSALVSVFCISVWPCDISTYYKKQTILQLTTYNVPYREQTFIFTILNSLSFNN